jgi:hypothetical protein
MSHARVHTHTHIHTYIHTHTHTLSLCKYIKINTHTIILNNSSENITYCSLPSTPGKLDLH